MPFLPCFASFKRKDKLVLLLVFVVLSLRASSQITNIGIENGMSNNSVTSICQDRKGFMWFATNDGLNRYDGYHFKIFRSIVNDTNSMISNRLTSIRCDENDNLWIGTKEGLCHYNLLSSKFNRFSYTDYATKKTVPLNVFITDILVRKDKSILVATGGNGLVKFDGTNPNGEQVPFLYGTKPAHNHYVTDMAEDANTGLVYCFVSGKGLCVYSNGSIKILNSELKEASSIALDGAGSIWISWQDGLHQYDIATNKYTRLLSQSNSALLNNIVYDIYIDSENKMWILTDGNGISILNLKDLVFENTNKLNSKLSSLATTKAFKDREGRLWLGTLRGGVSIYDTEKTMFENKVVDKRGEASGLVSNFILSFYEDQQGKNIWVGTDGYGVSIWNRETDRFTTLSHNNSPSSLSHNFVTGITGDYLGNIWLATFGGGVNRYKKESNSFEHYPLFNGDREDKDALRVYEDSRKNLWVSTMQYGLLYLLNRATNKFEVFNKELREVLVFSEDNEGQLWAGNYNKKLVKIDIEKKIYTSYDIGNLPRAIIPDRNGGLWIGTEGGGLLLFDKQKGSIKKQYTEANGLSNNFVLNILADSSGNLWMSTFNGISKFNPTTEKFDNYYQADGLVGNEFNYNAAVKLKNGFMMFGGIKGITMFDPSTIKSRKYFPPVYLSSFSVEGTPLKDSAYVTKQNGAVPKLKLKFSEATVSFDFVALEYSLPSKISYAYFLEGWDKEWNITNRPSANYSHIAEGRYILKVRSTNAEGEFGKETAVLEITVLPPWFRKVAMVMAYVKVIRLQKPGQPLPRNGFQNILNLNRTF